MGKKAIAIVSTDKHLDENNAIELLDIAEQEIQLAIDEGVNNVFWLGDIFDSRLSQRQEILNCLTLMLDIYAEADINVYCIPGNHDKTDYSSDESFLTPYRYHPNFTLYEEPALLTVDGVDCYFLPFYEQETFLKKLKQLPGGNKAKSVLLSHTAVQGSINNDGKVVNNNISLSLFKRFDKVILGHYHDEQQPGANVYHMPSTRQKDYGEGEKKGFYVLYDDITFKFVQSVFKPFKEIKINMAVTPKEDIINLAKTKTDGVNLRITLVGSQQEVKAINKKLFLKEGISVKVKYVDIEVTENEEKEVVQELTGSDIREKFEIFCEEKKYDYTEGYTLLKEIMQWQE